MGTTQSCIGATASYILLYGAIGNYTHLSMGLHGATRVAWGYTVLYGHYRELNNSASNTLLYGAKGKLRTFCTATGKYPLLYWGYFSLGAIRLCMGYRELYTFVYGLLGT